MNQALSILFVCFISASQPADCRVIKVYQSLATCEAARVVLALIPRREAVLMCVVPEFGELS